MDTKDNSFFPPTTSSSVTSFEILAENSIERGNESPKSRTVRTLERNRGRSMSGRSRAGTRAKSFIWGQEEPSQSLATSYDVKFVKENQLVHIEIDKSPDAHNFASLGQDTLKLAATLVNDAKLGKHSEFMEDAVSLKRYNLFHSRHMHYIFYLSLITNLSLAIFEKPSDPSLSLPYWITLLVEIITLLIFLYRFVHMKSFTLKNRFWSDTKNIVILVTLTLTFIDILIFVIMKNSSLQFGIRWSRALRPLFVVNFAETRQIRRAFRNIRQTLPDVSNVLFLFFINILIFTLMALKLFGRGILKYPDGSAYFSNFFDSFFDLYVLVTTANNPDVMMPAFDKSRWYIIFFVAFLLICLYIFMSIVLAVVYNNYRKHLKAEVKKSVLNKRENLDRAFELLKVEINGKFVITRARFNTLLENVPPKRSRILISILWYVLDEQMKSYIEKHDFFKLADLLNVEVSEIKDRKNVIEKICPRVYNSIPSVFIRSCVLHKYFRYVFDIFIVLNAFFIILDIKLADWIFLGFFLLEILLKLYTLGFKYFFKRFWNTFDFVVIGSAVITTVVQQLTSDTEDEAPTLDALLVLRVLRLVKIIANVERFRVIVVTLMHICPFILIYGGVLFVFYYFFAIIGMEIFNGLVTYRGYDPNQPVEDLFCGNIKLNGTDFARNHYCNNNFNNILNAMIVLFELTVVNQWHVLTAGFVAVTNKWARLYFLTFHLSCVIIVLNIFTAFVLEAFLLELSFSKGKMESAMEQKIQQLGLGIDKETPELWVSYTDFKKDEGLIKQEHISDDVADRIDETQSTDQDESVPDLSHDTDIRFHLSKNVQDVEILLQRMFENELEGVDHPEDSAKINEKIDACFD